MCTSGASAWGIPSSSAAAELVVAAPSACVPVAIASGPAAAVQSSHLFRGQAACTAARQLPLPASSSQKQRLTVLNFGDEPPLQQLESKGSASVYLTAGGRRCSFHAARSGLHDVGAGCIPAFGTAASTVAGAGSDGAAAAASDAGCTAGGSTEAGGSVGGEAMAEATDSTA